jgi:hypothetical protein
LVPSIEIVNSSGWLLRWAAHEASIAVTNMATVAWRIVLLAV